jgi:hypothetical protein
MPESEHEARLCSAASALCSAHATLATKQLARTQTQQQAPLAPAISAQSAKQLLPRLFLLPLTPQRNKEPPIIAVAAFNPPVPSCLALQFSSALPFISAAVSELEDGSWFMDGIGLDQTQ